MKVVLVKECEDEMDIKLTIHADFEKLNEF
jgi:hypothetical protein